jgi:hypothetical protein
MGQTPNGPHLVISKGHPACVTALNNTSFLSRAGNGWRFLLGRFEWTRFGFRRSPLAAINLLTIQPTLILAMLACTGHLCPVQLLGSRVLTLPCTS